MERLSLRHILATEKTVRNAVIAIVLLGATAACTAPDPRTSAVSDISAVKGWVDAAMIPPNADTDDMLISNRGDAGN